MRIVTRFVLLMLMLTVGRGALAASIPEACEAAKQKLAGQLGKCLHSAEKALATSGDAAKYTAAVAKCTSKFSASWQAAEQKAVDQGGACPTAGDGPTVLGAISASVACVTSEITSGPTTCLTCGNGVIDPGEDCDVGTLGGATCDDATGGTLAFGTLGCRTDCTFDTTACSVCPPGGQMVGGYCWILGGADASCDATCAEFGLVYDTATKTYAGSDGTDANCSAVMAALGQTSTIGAGGPPGGIGCWAYAYGGSNRDTVSPTVSTFHYKFGQRACACH